MKKHMVGLDLGGTKMLAGVLDGSYNVLVREKNKTPSQKGNSAVLKAMASTVLDAIKNAGVKKEEIAGLGIAVPGTLDREKGIILNTPNLGFKNVDVSGFMKKETGLDVVIENDVNAGAYGEYVHGAAADYKHIIALFPGTGLGGALILNGRLYRGAAGNAGEIGHMIIQTGGPLCGCGQRGCLEALASRTAMAKDAVTAAAAGRAPETYKEFGTDIKKYKSKVFSSAVKAKETSITEIIDRGAYYLGIGMANCVNIFNPELILLGGGLIEKLGESYITAAEEVMRSHAMESLVKGVKVKAARLGDDAVFTGAAAVAAEELI